MKKSEYYKQQADKEENNFTFWALLEKSKREKRQEDFEEHHLENIRKSEKVLKVTVLPNLYKIHFKDGSIFDFYPKKNRVCETTNRNKWSSNGIRVLLSKI